MNSPCINTGVVDLFDPDGSRSDIGAKYFDHLSPITINYNSNENWNLVGLPVIMDNVPIHTLFPESIDNTLITLSEQGSYLNVDTMSVGTGYWLRFETNSTSTLTGLPITENTITVRQGWNLISGLSMDVGINSIVDPDSLIHLNTLYSCEYGYYDQVDSIKTGSAYWIKSSGEGEIEIRLNP